MLISRNRPSQNLGAPEPRGLSSAHRSSVCTDTQARQANKKVCLQDEVRQVGALTHFHAPDQSLTSLSRRALTHQGPLAPALDSKRRQLLKSTAELKGKAREVDACLEVCIDMRFAGVPSNAVCFHCI